MGNRKGFVPGRAPQGPAQFQFRELLVEADRLLAFVPHRSQNVISDTLCRSSESLRPAQKQREGSGVPLFVGGTAGVRGVFSPTDECTAHSPASEGASG